MDFSLPDAFTTVRIADHTGREFEVAISRQPDHYEQWLDTSRPFSAIAKILIQILQGHGTLIDVGANIGTISLPVANAGSRVLAIEMLPINCLKLNLSALANGLGRMTVHQAGATNSIQMLEFSGDGPWGAVSSGTAAPQYAAGYPIDTILGTLGDSLPFGEVVVKIDVEGHEFEVLQGCENLISSYRPVIVFESIEGDAALNSRASRKHLQDRGYKLFMTRDALPNCIFVPRTAEELQVGFLTDYVAIPHEKVGRILGLLAEFPVRELTDDEKLQWVTETAESQQLVAHRVHAALVAHDLATRSQEPLKSQMLKILKLLSTDADASVRTAADEVAAR